MHPGDKAHGHGKRCSSAEAAEGSHDSLEAVKMIRLLQERLRGSRDSPTEGSGLPIRVALS